MSCFCIFRCTSSKKQATVGFFGPRKPLFASRKPRIAQATDLVQGKTFEKYEYEFKTRSTLRSMRKKHLPLMRALRNPATSKGSRILRPSSERSSSGIHTNKEWSSTTQRWRGEPTSVLALSRALGLDLKGEKGEKGKGTHTLL